MGRGRPRKHTKHRKPTVPQVHTSLDIDKDLYTATGHLALDEKKSKAMVLNEALKLYLKLKGRLPDVELPPELEDLIGE